MPVKFGDTGASRWGITSHLRNKYGRPPYWFLKTYTVDQTVVKKIPLFAHVGPFGASLEIGSRVIGAQHCWRFDWDLPNPGGFEEVFRAAEH